MTEAAGRSLLSEVERGTLRDVSVPLIALVWSLTCEFDGHNLHGVEARGPELLSLVDSLTDITAAPRCSETFP